MLAVSDFINAAGLPMKWQERDLQTYLMRCLQSRGYQVVDEVKSNGGRADIVSDYLGGSIIEVKKYLDRDTVYQAAGQLLVYGLGNKRKLVIMGFLTPDASKQESAFTTANLICQDERYSVVFVNMDSQWYPGASVKGRNWFSRFKMPTPQMAFNLKWLRNPPPTSKVIFSLLRLLVKFTTTHPLPVFLAIAILFAIATNQPEESKKSQPVNQQSLILKKWKP